MIMASRIYIDTCCFIEHAKGCIDDKSGFDEKDLEYVGMILEAGLQGAVELYTSSVTISECLHTGDGTNISDEIKRLFRSILTSGKILSLISADLFIAERARDLRWDDNITLKPLDAIHLASAIDAECEEIWTGDHFGKQDKEARKVLSNDLGVRIVLPKETSLLPPEYKQRSLFPKKSPPPKARGAKENDQHVDAQDVSEIIAQALEEAGQESSEIKRQKSQCDNEVHLKKNDK